MAVLWECGKLITLSPSLVLSLSSPIFGDLELRFLTLLVITQCAIVKLIKICFKRNSFEISISRCLIHIPILCIYIPRECHIKIWAAKKGSWVKDQEALIYEVNIFLCTRSQLLEGSYGYHCITNARGWNPGQPHTRQTPYPVLLSIPPLSIFF